MSSDKKINLLDIDATRWPHWRSDDGNVLLINADCLEVLPTLPKVDAVVTDPPYGIGAKWKGGFSDKHGWGASGREAEARNTWDAKPPEKADLDRLLSAGRFQVVWGGNYFDLPQSRGWYVWNKPERGFTLAEAELAWTNRDNVIRVFDVHRSDVGREHPTQKPLEVMEKSIEYLPKANSILDPFMGSGTTGVACVRLGRQFIGIELEPRYYEIAIKRIKAEIERFPLFEQASKPVTKTLPGFGEWE